MLKPPIDVSNHAPVYTSVSVAKPNHALGQNITTLLHSCGCHAAVHMARRDRCNFSRFIPTFRIPLHVLPLRAPGV